MRPFVRDSVSKRTNTQINLLKYEEHHLHDTLRISVSVSMSVSYHIYVRTYRYTHSKQPSDNGEYSACTFKPYEGMHSDVCVCVLRTNFVITVLSHLNVCVYVRVHFGSVCICVRSTYMRPLRLYMRLYERACTQMSMCLKCIWVRIQ